MHGSHKKISASLFLLLGIIYLIVDLSSWTFWNINWWTAVLLVIGVSHVAMAHGHCCDDKSNGKNSNGKKNGKK